MTAEIQNSMLDVDIPPGFAKVSRRETATRTYSTISSTARWPWRAAELANNARIA